MQIGDLREDMAELVVAVVGVVLHHNQWILHKVGRQSQL